MVRETIERDGQAAIDVLLFALACGADVNGQRRLGGSEAFGGGLCAESFGGDDQVGPRIERAQTILEIAGDVVEADTAEPNGGFVLASGSRDDDDGVRMIEDGAGPRRVLASKADVDAAGEVGGGELVGVASV